MKDKANIPKVLGMLVVTSLITIVMLNLAFAGFGSSYLEDVNGTKYLYVQPGVVQSYFIYPQNLNNETLYIKIQVEDVNKTLQNSLKDAYAIPANTDSDKYPIELKFKVPSNTPLGTNYPVKYSVYSATEVNNSGMVQFGDVGYEKSFFVGVKDLGIKKTSSYLWLYIILGIVILVFIGIVLYMVILLAQKEPKKISNVMKTNVMKKPKSNNMRFTNA
jgi:hypothetical protein